MPLLGCGGLSVDLGCFRNFFKTQTQTTAPNTVELGFLRLRYKEPTSAKSQLLEWPLEKTAITQNIDQTSDGFRFAAAVSA